MTRNFMVISRAARSERVAFWFCVFSWARFESQVKGARVAKQKTSHD